MINFEDVTKESVKQHKQNWSQIIGASGSEENEFII